MVDMAFLLVTFFLLATTFKMPEQAKIQLPLSTSEVDIPQQNLITVSVDREGAVYLAMSNQDVRSAWFRRMAAMNDIEVTPEEERAFASLPGFGHPLESLIPHLSLTREEQLKRPPTGIPADTIHNQLEEWLIAARGVQPGLRFAIKADHLTSYRHLSKVIGTMTGNKILRFNLVTDKRREDEGFE